jgi:hypothetical protein
VVNYFIPGHIQRSILIPSTRERQKVTHVRRRGREEERSANTKSFERRELLQPPSSLETRCRIDSQSRSWRKHREHCGEEGGVSLWDKKTCSAPPPEILSLPFFP